MQDFNAGRFIVTLLIFALFPFLTHAQALSGASLSGTVTDAEGGEPLVGVYVYFPSLGNGVVTDIDGHYEITGLPEVKTMVQVSYLGHKSIVTSVDLSTAGRMDFAMEESDAALSAAVVTGLTGDVLLKNTPAPVTVISSRELHSHASTNIIDALAHKPGLSQITTGGGISKPVIRGLGYNRVVVVGDGIRQEDQQWGDEHGIGIDDAGVGSVEILKGPASLLYGSDAMAGVVIFHSYPIQPEGSFSGKITSEYQGNSGLRGGSVDFAGNKGGFVWSGVVSGKKAHEYHDGDGNQVPGTQFSQRSFSLMAGKNGRWGYSHLKTGYYHLTPSLTEEDAVPSPRNHYSHTLPFQEISHLKVVWDNNLFIGDDGSLKFLVGYQGNDRREFVESSDEPDLHLRLHTLNYNLRFVRTGTVKLSAGTGGMWQKSENLGEEYLIPDYRLFDFGAFTMAEWSSGPWNLSGGVRFDMRHFSSDTLTGRFEETCRNIAGLTGSVGVVYNVSEDVNVRANVSRGFRAPNVNELCANGEHEGTWRYEMGDSSLGNESSWQGDLGMDWSSEYISGTVALFANRINGFIYLEGTGGLSDEGVPVYRYTSGNAVLAGGETRIDIHPVPRLHFENNFSYVNARLIGGRGGNRWLPYTPAPRFNSELRYDIVTHGKTLDGTYVGIAMEYDFRQDHVYSAGGTETPTGAYTILDLKAGTDIKYHGKAVASLYLMVQNLLDERYSSHLSRLRRMGFYNPGRNFSVKLVVPFM